MEISTTEKRESSDGDGDGLEDFLRFGMLLLLGLSFGISLLLEALFTESFPPEENGGGLCGRNNNVLGSLLGLGHLLPPISPLTRFLLWLAIDAFCFLLGYFWLRMEKERLRLLVQRWKRVWVGSVGRVLAWVCVLSAFLFLINNTSSCFGVMAVSCLTTCLVGAVNLVADPEDGVALSRWVFEQSIVIAFLVAVREGGGGGPSSFNLRAALFPIVAALWAILVHKINALIASKELQLPISIFFSEEDSEYEPIPELDESEMDECECREFIVGACCTDAIMGGPCFCQSFISVW